MKKYHEFGAKRWLYIAGTTLPLIFNSCAAKNGDTVGFQNKRTPAAQDYNDNRDLLRNPARLSSFRSRAGSYGPTRPDRDSQNESQPVQNSRPPVQAPAQTESAPAEPAPQGPDPIGDAFLGKIGAATDRYVSGVDSDFDRYIKVFEDAMHRYVDWLLNDYTAGKFGDLVQENADSFHDTMHAADTAVKGAFDVAMNPGEPEAENDNSNGGE